MTAAPPSQPALLKPSRDTATPQTLTGTLTGIWMSLPLASERLAMPVTLPTFGALSARAVPPIRATAAAVAASTPATRVLVCTYGSLVRMISRPRNSTTLSNQTQHRVTNACNRPSSPEINDAERGWLRAAVPVSRAGVAGPRSAGGGRYAALVPVGVFRNPAAVLQVQGGAGEHHGGDERDHRGERVLARHAGAQRAGQVNVEARREARDDRRRQRSGLGQRHHARYEQRRHRLHAFPACTLAAAAAGSDPRLQVAAGPRLGQRGDEQGGHARPGQRGQLGVQRPQQQPAQRRADHGDRNERRDASRLHGVSRTRSGRYRTPSRPRPASSAATGPRPGRLAAGSTSCQGARTNARSCARGWGRVSTGSSLTSPS